MWPAAAAPSRHYCRLLHLPGNASLNRRAKIATNIYISVGLFSQQQHHFELRRAHDELEQAKEVGSPELYLKVLPNFIDKVEPMLLEINNISGKQK